MATRVFQPSVISGGLRAAWAGRIQMSASGKKGEIGGRGHVQAMGADSALFCQAAENNKGYIAEVLQRHLLTSKFTDSVAADKPLLVLEIASDTGQHVAHFFATFSSKFPCVWQPSDLVSDTFSSIRYYATETEGALSRDNTCLEQPSYVLDPILLDVTEKSWAVHTENSSYWCKPQPIAARSQSSGAGKEDTIIPEELRAGKDSHFDAVINSNMIHITPYECCEGLFAGVNKVCALSHCYLMVLQNFVMHDWEKHDMQFPESSLPHTA